MVRAAGGRGGWTRASGRYCSPVARISTAAAVGDGEYKSGCDLVMYEIFLY